MPAFQLPTAVVLALSSTASTLVFFLSREKEGKISLPTDDSEDIQHDAFDVVKREDCVDGYPIDEEAFWRKVRRLICLLRMSVY